MTEATDFKAFLEDSVNLNQTRLNLLSQRIASIEAFLAGDEVFALHMTEVVPQGSFALGTIIKPVGTKDFDADILVPINEVEGWGAADYIQKLYEAFGRSPVYKSMRSRKKRCVTIDYSGDFHVDVVPYVTRSGETYVANRATDTFERAAPDDFTAWFEAKDRVTHGNLVKVVRLLKYLRDHKGRYVVPSVTLAAAVASVVDEHVGQDDVDAYRTTAGTLRAVSDALVDLMVSSPVSPPYIADPGTGRNLADRWKPANYQTFRDRFSVYAATIAGACDETDHDASIQIWRSLFGDSFGSSQALVSLSASQYGRNAVPPSERFLERDFHIETRLDPRYRFKTVGYLAPTKGFRNWPLPKRGDRVPKYRSLKFKIEASNIPQPYEVYWKIRNYGDEAGSADSLRGDIHKDDGSRTWTETTSYIGNHYVEAMIVKNGVCVARSRQNVIVI
jgi:hypothetical protein